MPRSRLTGFEQMLLGLIFIRPATGYDLKRRFATTSMGVYEPSSGALYPAPDRLERRGLPLLRFVMMAGVLPADAVIGFLASLWAALAEFVAALEQQLAAPDVAGNQYAGLAVEHGLAVHRASLAWAEQAMTRLAADSSRP